MQKKNPRTKLKQNTPTVQLARNHPTNRGPNEKSICLMCLIWPHAICSRSAKSRSYVALPQPQSRLSQRNTLYLDKEHFIFHMSSVGVHIMAVASISIRGHQLHAGPTRASLDEDCLYDYRGCLDNKPSVWYVRGRSFFSRYE